MLHPFFIVDCDEKVWKMFGYSSEKVYLCTNYSSEKV